MGAAAIGLKILSLMLLLQSFNFPLADGLTTRNLQSKRTITQFLAVLSGIVLYYVLSLKFGVVGGATAAVFIEVIMLLGFILFNPNKKIDNKNYSTLFFDIYSFYINISFLFKYVSYNSSFNQSSISSINNSITRQGNKS